MTILWEEAAVAREEEGARKVGKVRLKSNRPNNRGKSPSVAKSPQIIQINKDGRDDIAGHARYGGGQCGKGRTSTGRRAALQKIGGRMKLERSRKTRHDGGARHEFSVSKGLGKRVSIPAPN